MDHYPDFPPPPYPGLAYAGFPLPSYDQVIQLSEYEDSLRLPTYQGRTGQRFHPYFPVLRTSGTAVQDETRFYNTIYDESYTPLEVPPLAFSTRTMLGRPTPYRPTARQVQHMSNRRRFTIPPVPVFPPPPVPVTTDTSIDDQVDANVEAERLQRIQRLWHLVPEFVAAIIRALEAATTTTTELPALMKTTSAPPPLLLHSAEP